MPSGLAGEVMRVGAGFLLGSGGGSEQKGARGGAKAKRSLWAGLARVWVGACWVWVWGVSVGCACGVCVWGVRVGCAPRGKGLVADRHQDFWTGGAPVVRTDGSGSEPRFGDSGPPLWRNNRGEVDFVASVIGVSGAGGWGPGRRVVVDTGFAFAYGRCGWGLTPPVGLEAADGMKRPLAYRPFTSPSRFRAGERASPARIGHSLGLCHTGTSGGVVWVMLGLLLLLIGACDRSGADKTYVADKAPADDSGSTVDGGSTDGGGGGGTDGSSGGGVDSRIEVDADGDGYTTRSDCQDDNPAISPGAVEIAGDGVDQDCDLYDRPLVASAWVPLDFEPVGELYGRIGANLRVEGSGVNRMVTGITWDAGSAGPGLDIDEHGLDPNPVLILNPSGPVSVVGLGDEYVTQSLTYFGDLGADGQHDFAQFRAYEWSWEEGARWEESDWWGTAQVMARDPAGAATRFASNYPLDEDGSFEVVGVGPGPLGAWRGEVLFECSGPEGRGPTNIVGTADFTGDGLDELVISRYPLEEDAPAGTIYVLPHLEMPADCEVPLYTVLQTDVAAIHTLPLSISDVTGDGNADWVGTVIPSESAADARLAVWDIVASGGVLNAEDTTAEITTSAHMIGLQLNRDVAVGDHDGDTIPDLGIAVVDARPHRSGRESASRGSIAWFAGPIVGTLAIEDADRIFLGPTFDDGFGSGLVMGHDWDGDGREDVLVGAAYSAWDPEYPGALWITPFDAE